MLTCIVNTCTCILVHSRLHVTWPSCLTAWLSSSSNKIAMGNQSRRLWVCTAKMENMLTLMNLASVSDRYVHVHVHEIDTFCGF